MTHAKTVRALGEALELSKSRAGEIAKDPTFPAKGADGWDVAAARAWLAARRAPKDPPAEPAGAAPNFVAARAPAAANPLIEAKALERLELELRALSANDPRRTLVETRDPLALAEAAVILAAQRFSAAPEPELGRELKGALEELRRTASDAIDLGVKRGTLIERDVAKACMGEIAQRFVRVLATYETRLSLQIDVWLGDPAFRSLGPDARARAVRAWIEDKSHAVRAAEADDMERLIANELADREKA